MLCCLNHGERYGCFSPGLCDDDIIEGGRAPWATPGSRRPWGGSAERSRVDVGCAATCAASRVRILSLFPLPPGNVMLQCTQPTSPGRAALPDRAPHCAAKVDKKIRVQ
eukprot:scaffold196759_cov33-Tisochrysis_lutea.AAC.2